MIPRELVIKYLTEAINKFKADSSELDEEQMIKIAQAVAHVPMSLEEACDYMNLSRSRFGDLVRQKKIPKGRKRKGWRELAWYRDELDIAKKWM